MVAGVAFKGSSGNSRHIAKTSRLEGIGAYGVTRNWC